MPVAGIFLTAWAFIIVSGITRFILSIDRPTFAVARVVLDEALHSHLAIGFIVVLLLVLAMLAAILTGDAEQPLRYRVQLFLSWSYIALGIMLAVLTILFSCWTLTSEIKLQRIVTVAAEYAESNPNDPADSDDPSDDDVFLDVAVCPLRLASNTLNIEHNPLAGNATRLTRQSRGPPHHHSA